MKKYMKEAVLLLIQLFMFYIFPLFAGPTDVMGMVVLIILATLVFSIIVGCISTEKIKYLYPIVIAIMFVPSVYIHYNETAFVHSIWYLVISTIGLLVGITIDKLIHMKNNKANR